MNFEYHYDTNLMLQLSLRDFRISKLTGARGVQAARLAYYLIYIAKNLVGVIFETGIFLLLETKSVLCSENITSLVVDTL